MNYAKSYIDCFRKYAAAVAAEKAARAALEAEYNDRSITKATFDAKLAAILETAPKEAESAKRLTKSLQTLKRPILHGLCWTAARSIPLIWP